MRIPLLPLLLSSVALPAVAGDYTATCYTAADSLGCMIEQAEFNRQRNVEIDASIARVDRVRARELALSLTHCKSRYSRTPRCLAERAQRFAANQNDLIEASIARVAEVRAFEAARRAEADASMAAVEARRTRQLELRQNALIAASMAAAESERQRRFAAHQNALASASVERVAVERSRQLAWQLSPCSSQTDTRPRCEAKRAREFVTHQRALATASMQRVEAERARAFAAARNAEAAASIAAVERNRAVRGIETAAIAAPIARMTAQEYAAMTSHCVRAPASPRCEAERIREFAAARNAEIERSIAAVATARASREAAASRNAEFNTGTSPLETGAISIPTLPRMPEVHAIPDNLLRQDISADPCSVKPLQPVQFNRGARLDKSITPELDRLAGLAQSCPGMRIEVHGYADGGSPYNNRNLAQARAQAIADYLIANGVAPNRIAAIGRGGRQSLLPYAEGYDPAFGGRAEVIVRDPSTDAAARRVMWDLAELLDPRYIPAVANLSP